MKILDVQVRELSVPLAHDFSGGTYKVTKRATLMCRVETSAGITGEVCVGNEDSYSAELKRLIRGPIREMLLGEDPICTERHWLRMLSLDRPYADRESVWCAISTVDTALWDLKGRITGQPIWKLLGGHRQTVPIIGIGGYYETSHSGPEIREEIARLKHIGLAGIKFKVGAADIATDAERVKAARDAAGPAFLIVIDSNRAWSTDDAIKFADMVAPCHPAWIEEPIHPHYSARGLRECRLKSGLRICAGQSEVSAFECFSLVEGSSVDVVNLQYNRGGGITGWLKIAHAASLVGVAVTQTGEPHIGMHLIAGVGNSMFVECYPDPARDPFWYDLYDDRPKIADGLISVPDKPGIGLIFDLGAVEKYSIEPWT